MSPTAWVKFLRRDTGTRGVHHGKVGKFETAERWRELANLLSGRALATDAALQAFTERLNAKGREVAALRAALAHCLRANELRGWLDPTAVERFNCLLKPAAEMAADAGRCSCDKVRGYCPQHDGPFMDHRFGD